MKTHTVVAPRPQPQAPASLTVLDWTRAKALCTDARKGADALIALGEELAELKRQWLQPGSRTDLATSGQGCPEVAGWMKTVEAELGISYKTADRIIERAAALRTLIAVRDQAVPSVEVAGRQHKVTARLAELARQQLDAVERFEAGPERAWAGFCGAVNPAAGAALVNSRADHARHLLEGLRTFQLHLFTADEQSRWEKFPPKAKSEILTAVETSATSWPDELVLSVAQVAKQRGLL
jgi:hypothetical protein